MSSPNETEEKMETEEALPCAAKPEPTSIKKSNTRFIMVNKNIVHKPPHVVDLSRKLMCIEYPGIVENVDKMIETLGGMQTIETTVGNYSRRLELRFRPEDIFSKPCWGDKDFNPGLLVKIKVRRPKIKIDQPSTSTTEAKQNQAVVYSYDIVGVTAMTFKFTRLCDFQYLPLVPTEKIETAKAKCKNIYEDIIPKEVPDYQWFQSNESASMPLFFPPALFAKFNTSKENRLFYERYKFYEKVLPETAERLKKDSLKKNKDVKNVIDISRRNRKAFSQFVNFYSKEITIPESPTEEALKTINRRGLLHGPYEKIREYFEERPIWSKAALLYRSGIRSDHLKVVLPGIGYYCSTGPWRILWCRFGYDPRTDANSRIYQTFDFRIRSSEGSTIKVHAKRRYTSNLMHYKAGPFVEEKFSLKDCSHQQRVKPKLSADEASFILRPKMLPPARQMFYQYCDLEIPEIQNMLAKLPVMGKETKWHPKDGWLPAGFSDQCREIANKYVTIEVQNRLQQEKQRRDEELSSSLEEASKKETVEDDLPVLQDTITIDSDEEQGDNVNSEGEEADMTDSDVEHAKGNEDEDDEIDMEAVDEINKLIGNVEASETLKTEEDKEDDSGEEYDPELINLYQQLIVSSSDNEKNSKNQE